MSIRFYRGNKSKYDSEKYKDALYFAKDTNEIIVNGSTYGNAKITDFTNDNGNLKISMSDGSSKSTDINIGTLPVGSETDTETTESVYGAMYESNFLESGS